MPTNPLFYKACTSGVAYVLGDLASQLLSHKRHGPGPQAAVSRDLLENLDLVRTLRSGTAGFVSHGPLCHLWMVFMEVHKGGGLPRAGREV